MPNMEKVIKRYNGIMNDVCYEHHTIGTRFSEDTEHWNLRDMVAECDYILSTYYEEWHTNYYLKQEDRATWASETGKLKRFINRYEPFINDLVCYCNHCSKYDNEGERV